MASRQDTVRLASRSLLGELVDEAQHVIGRLIANRRVLIAVTRVELRQRYAGSFLGSLWYLLHWALLLGMYSFVYVVIFRQRMPEFGQFGYVLFILAGLVPYFGISDALASGTASVRANMAFHRNAVFPLELIPVKAVLVAILSQAVAVGLVAVLGGAAGFAGWHLLYLPVPFFLECLFLIGLVWVLSGINVLIPDVQQGMTLALWFLLFVSPIGFTLAQVPPEFRWLVWLNPLSYLIEEFRFALLGLRSMGSGYGLPVLSIMAVVTFLLGGAMFRRLMGALGDYE